MPIMVPSCLWRELLYVVFNGASHFCSCLRLASVLIACGVLTCSSAGWTEPLDHGSVSGFPSYDETNALLTKWLSDYPQLLRRQSIGESYMGRPIYTYILSNSSSKAHKPKVLVTSLMHSREPAGLTVVLYFLGRIMELYRLGDPEATYVVEMREVWCVPFVNPDGYIANEQASLLGSGRMIRKNQRPTCDSVSNSGVDINRNFGFHWKPSIPKMPGALSGPCEEEYPGSEPFSEPETRALKWTCEQNHFKAAINFHAYGSMLTHPFNYAKAPLPKDDQAIYDEIAKVFRYKLFGTATSTVGYTTPGESDDWMYGEAKIISMSPEVGPENGGFWPNSAEIAPINQHNYPRITYVVRKAGMELHSNFTCDFESDAGSLDQGVINIHLANKGLSASGKLILAISGLVKRSSVAVNSTRSLNVPIVSVGSVQQPYSAALFDGTFASSQLSVLAFGIEGLPRRSSTQVQIFPGKTWALHSPWEPRLCAFEVNQYGNSPAEKYVCHCIGPTPNLVFASSSSGPWSALCRDTVAAKAAFDDNTVTFSYVQVRDIGLNDPDATQIGSGGRLVEVLMLPLLILGAIMACFVCSRAREATLAQSMVASKTHADMSDFELGQRFIASKSSPDTTPTS